MVKIICSNRLRYKDAGGDRILTFPHLSRAYGPQKTQVCTAVNVREACMGCTALHGVFNQDVCRRRDSTAFNCIVYSRLAYRFIPPLCIPMVGTMGYSFALMGVPTTHGVLGTSRAWRAERKF